MVVYVIEFKIIGVVTRKSEKNDKKEPKNNNNWPWKHEMIKVMRSYESRDDVERRCFGGGVVADRTRHEKENMV